MAPCQVCARPAETRCSKCKMAIYCSSTCQTASWRTHKQLCTRLSTTSPVPPVSSTCLPAVVLLGKMDGSCGDMHNLMKDFFTELHRRSTVVFACSPQVSMVALDLKPQAIVLVDDGIMGPGWSSILSRVMKQTKSEGCRLVIGGMYPTRARGLDDIFRTLGVPWRYKDYYRTDFDLSPKCTAPIRSTTGLAASFSMKASHLDYVPASDALYVPPRDAKLQSAVFLQETLGNKAGCGAAYMKYGAGWLGYHGDNNFEGSSTRAQLAMCGLELNECTLERQTTGRQSTGVNFGADRIMYAGAEGINNIDADPTHISVATDVDFWMRPGLRISNAGTPRSSRWDPNRPTDSMLTQAGIPGMGL